MPTDRENMDEGGGRKTSIAGDIKRVHTLVMLARIINVIIEIWLHLRIKRWIYTYLSRQLIGRVR